MKKIKQTGTYVWFRTDGKSDGHITPTQYATPSTGNRQNMYIGLSWCM